MKSRALTADTSSDHKRGSRIPELDGLRGLAILLVIVWHYWINRIQPSPFSALATRVFGLSWSGVDLFFVLSGFLIGGILFDYREAGNYFKVFYARRICRIVPLYYFVLALFIYSVWAGPGLTAKAPNLFDKPIPFWFYPTFTQNFAMIHAGNFGPGWLGVTWSLAVEEQFYIILPFVIRYVPKRKLPYVLTCLILLAPVGRIVLSSYYPETFVPPLVMMPCRADALLLGVMCAYLVRQRNGKAWLQSHLKHLYVLLSVLVAVAALLESQSYQPGTPSMMIVGYSCLDLLYACLLLIAISEKRGIVTTITRNFFLRWCGMIAYGLYLFHEPVNGLCHGLFLGAPPQVQTTAGAAVTVGGFAISFGLASLSWIAFERRIVQFGHSFKYKFRSSSSPIGDPNPLPVD